MGGGHSINKGNFFEKIFFRFFFYKCKHCIVWNWFIVKINLISQNNFFEAIQRSSKSHRLNRGMSSNFWWLRSTNHMKFTDECMMCIEKHVLVKKMFTDEVNMSLLLWACKEGHAENLLEYERIYHFDFLEKGETVNSAPYCQLLGPYSPYLMNDLSLK